LGAGPGAGGRKNVKSSRFGPIRLVVEAKFVGASPQLTPNLVWSTGEKKKISTKKVADPGIEPATPDSQAVGSNQGLISLYKAYKAYKAFIRLLGLPRAPEGRPRVNSKNRSDPHGVTLILVGKRVLRATQVVLSPFGRFHFFDFRDSNHRPSSPTPLGRTALGSIPGLADTTP